MLCSRLLCGTVAGRTLFTAKAPLIRPRSSRRTEEAGSGAMERVAVRVLRPGHTCWRIEQADRIALIVDAADYFRAAQSAMLKAQHSILMIGWDFDTRISLDPTD